MSLDFRIDASTLPAEFQRLINTIRELDERSQCKTVFPFPNSTSFFLFFLFICRGFDGLFLELFFGGGSHDKSDEAADEVLLGVVLSELKKREKKMRPHLLNI